MGENVMALNGQILAYTLQRSMTPGNRTNLRFLFFHDDEVYSTPKQIID